MYYPYFIAYIGIGLIISLTVFFWALRNGQFQEQQRAFSAVIVPAAVDPASAVAEETLLGWYEENTSD